MKKRMQALSHKMLESDKNVSDRVIEVGSLCMELNELFSEAVKGNGEKLKEVALKCVEIGIVSDSVSYELYLGNQVEIVELNKKMNEAIEKL